MSELSTLSCWVSKKKRSLLAIFGKSYVKKWLTVDPHRQIVEYSDSMHGMPKTLCTFENIINVTYEQNHQTKRALTVVSKKRLPRQAQDAVENTQFVFESDLSLALAVFIFSYHPLALMSEAERIVLPKSVFDLIPSHHDSHKRIVIHRPKRMETDPLKMASIAETLDEPIHIDKRDEHKEPQPSIADWQPPHMQPTQNESSKNAANERSNNVANTSPAVCSTPNICLEPMKKEAKLVLGRRGYLTSRMQSIGEPGLPLTLKSRIQVQSDLRSKFPQPSAAGDQNGSKQVKKCMSFNSVYSKPPPEPNQKKRLVISGYLQKSLSGPTVQQADSDDSDTGERQPEPDRSTIHTKPVSMTTNKSRIFGYIPPSRKVTLTLDKPRLMVRNQSLREPLISL